MKDDRTPEQKLEALLNAITKCHAKGWLFEGNIGKNQWIFRDPSGNLQDLSAADLSQLEYIEQNKSFLIK